MNSDKRTPHTDALETLGTIIGPEEKRDAIHLAVENCVAYHTLKPGQEVGFVNAEKRLIGKANYGKAGKAVGIVDPFLKRNVQPGENFWLVVFPRQITSLRHVWTHPDFPAVEEVADEAKELDYVESSRIWIEEYASSLNLDYDELIYAAQDWVLTSKGSRWGGNYLCKGGDLEGVSTNPEFWKHYQIVTGEEVPEQYQSNFFTCSC